MQPSSFVRVSAMAVAGMLAGLGGSGQAGGGEPLQVTVAMSDGEPVTGPLEGITDTSIVLATESGLRELPVAAVRRIDGRRGEEAAVAGVSVIGTDGSRLSGTDVTWEGETVSS